MTDFGGTYDVGTVTILNGASVATFSGTLMTTQAEVGDHIFTNGLIAMVDVVTDDTHLALKHPWSGADVTAAEYVLNKMSWLRYDPSLTQAKAREFLAFFEGVGTFYFVEGASPDPGLGQDGQFALKVNSGAWLLWYRTGGVWVLQGSPAGVNPTGPYNAATTYTNNDWVSWQGSLWSSLQASNLNHTPDVSPTYWRKELSGGDRYDLLNFDTDRPADGETVLVAFPESVTFLAGLSSSYAKAEVASTGTAVYSIKKNGAEFATVTFTASNVGVIACPTNTSFVHGDKYEMTAPSPRDATLSGVAINIIGYR